MTRIPTILLFNDTSSEFLSKYVLNLVGALQGRGQVRNFTHEQGRSQHWIDEVLDPNLAYFSRVKDSRIYANVLDYCTSNRIDHLFFPRLLFPEYLLSELKVRTSLSIRISFATFGMHDMFRSAARANCYAELLAMPQVHRMVIHTIAGKTAKLPPNASRYIAGPAGAKIILGFDPIYESAQDYAHSAHAKRDYGFADEDFVVLFFGSMFYGKGPDILYSAIDQTSNRVKYLIASDPTTLNFDFSAALLQTHARVTFIDRFIQHEELGGLFGASDIVALPYRKTYEFNTSGVLVQAAMARKPVVGPQFYPFSEVIERWSLGVLFQAEDASSLAASIEYAAAGYAELVRQAEFDAYVREVQSWEELADSMFFS